MPLAAGSAGRVEQVAVVTHGCPLVQPAAMSTSAISSGGSMCIGHGHDMHSPVSGWWSLIGACWGEVSSVTSSSRGVGYRREVRRDQQPRHRGRRPRPCQPRVGCRQGRRVSDLERAGAKLRRARVAVAAAIEEAERVALAALAEGETEVAVARALGVDRMTVRKWAGKR